MPNWCHNTLIVQGDPAELEEFKQRASVAQDGTEEQALYFSSLVPEPGVAGENDDFDWYSWRVNNWGTKWEPSFGEPFVAFGTADARFDAKRSGVQSFTGTLRYRFDTAWAPPSEWALTVSRLFPTLSFELSFGEPGGDFAGREVFMAGAIVSSESLPIDQVLEPEEMWF